MIRGLYTSGHGMLTLQMKMDVVSNNLSNTDTTGYKKDSLTFESFGDIMTSRMYDTKDLPSRSVSVGKMSLFNNIGQIFTNFAQGHYEQSGSPTDMAMNGDNAAFFSVLKAEDSGEMKEYYTRDGGFVVSTTGVLSTRAGLPVVGQNGPIYLTGSDFNVTASGGIIQDGVLVDTLKVRSFQNPDTLRKFGYNLVETTDESTDKPFTGTVLQGSLEASNVDAVREMVDMITIMRGYEANAKLVQMQDGTLDKAVNEIGPVR
jgi:flagellar basal-body rod protein FlgF